MKSTTKAFFINCGLVTRPETDTNAEKSHLANFPDSFYDSPDRWDLSMKKAEITENFLFQKFLFQKQTNYTFSPWYDENVCSVVSLQLSRE